VRSLAAEYRAVHDLESDRRHLLRVDCPQVIGRENLDWMVLPVERAETTLRAWLDETRGDLDGIII
jgi:hypothetical protein